MSVLFENYGMTAQKGDYIFKEGDAADCMFLIHSGEVKVSRMVKNSEEVLQVLKEGEFVGEMAIINALPRSADAIAATDCELIRMDKESFENTVQVNNKFAVSFIRFLSERLRHTNDLVNELSEQSMSQDFFIEVLKEFMINGKKAANGQWILLNLNHFLEKFKKKHHGNEDKFWTVMDNTLGTGHISLKKDSKGSTWIALKV